MGWTFNSPPGWPEQPPGWSPPPGWTPDPRWPPPPAGWQFWVASAPATTAAAPLPQPHPPGRPPRAWFARWWGVLGLAGALLVGGLIGFGGTSLALSGDGDGGTPTALDTPQPTAPASPTGEPEPSPDLSPDLSPEPTGQPTGAPDEMCGEVAVIMVQMLGDNLDAFEQDDPQAELVASRRAAADALRGVEVADAADQEALDTFADELDAAADELEGGPMTEERYIDFVDRGSAAWDDFNAATGC